MLYSFAILFSTFVVESNGLAIAAAAPVVVEVELALIGGGFAPGGSQRESKGHCGWFGRAPICRGSCPVAYVHIKSSTGWQVNNDVRNEYFDASFGFRCWSGQKHLCCRVDPMECLWKGVYADELNRRWSCDYYMESQKLQDIAKRCGELHCTRMGGNINDLARILPLKGPQCTEFEMDGHYGRASCGIIKYFQDKDSEASVYSWIKMGHSN